MLPVEQMRIYEKWAEDINKKGFRWPMSVEDVKRQLNLDVIEKDLGCNLEARLVPPINADSNGVIEINTRTSSDNKFGYAHEVVHYLKDVGVNNKVSKEYSRLVHPSSIDPHERDIDYCTAAFSIPKKDLADEIKKYRENWYKTDEITFFKRLLTKYSCNKECLLLRIKEIRKLGVLE